MYMGSAQRVPVMANRSIITFSQARVNRITDESGRMGIACGKGLSSPPVI